MIIVQKAAKKNVDKFIHAELMQNLSAEQTSVEYWYCE